MPRSFLLPVLALVVSLTLPPALTAQAGIPGRGIDEQRGLRGEYLTYAMRGIRQTLAEWSGAWRAGDPARLRELYSEEAILSPPLVAATLRGQEAIGAYWETFGAKVGEVTLEMGDFDVSSGIAFVQGDYGLRAGASGGQERTGVHLTVLVLEGRSWRIRSQVFRPGAAGA